MTEGTLPPPVAWAQRSDVVFLTINLEDCKDPEVKFTENSVYFKGTGGLQKKTYEVTIPLYKEIDPEQSKTSNRERFIEILLTKAKTQEPFWPTLTSDKTKHHWLKCDFNKWVEEDDSGEEGPNMPDDSAFQRMFNMDGGNARNLNFDDEEDRETDSDDEPIPELQ